MVEDRAPREGLGLMSVGGAVFLVAALVAAIVSPLAGELDRTIRETSSPVAQASTAGERGAPGSAAVKVLRLPPMRAVAGTRVPVDEPETARGRRGLGAGRRQALAAAAPAPQALRPAPAPAAPSDHVAPVDPAIQAPTELPESKPAPGRSGDAPSDRATAAGSDRRGGSDRLRTRPEHGGQDAAMQASGSADAHPSRGSKRRRA